MFRSSSDCQNLFSAYVNTYLVFIVTLNVIPAHALVPPLASSGVRHSQPCSKIATSQDSCRYFTALAVSPCRYGIKKVTRRPTRSAALRAAALRACSPSCYSLSSCKQLKCKWSLCSFKSCLDGVATAQNQVLLQSPILAYSPCSCSS